MGTVTVTGRDELGRIIDVTLTTNADVPPPGPEVVPEGGGGGGGVPDPAEAPDGQVPTTAGGEYELAAGVGAVQVVQRSISSAELLALNTSPIELVAGVAGQLIWGISALVIYRFGTTPYVAGSQALVVAPAASATADGSLELTSATAFLQETQDVFAVLAPGTAGGEFFYNVDTVGQALEICLVNSDPTGGDGTLDLTVFYRIVDVS